MDQKEITEKLRQQNIDWKFNPPAAGLGKTNADGHVEFLILYYVNTEVV